MIFSIRSGKKNIIYYDSSSAISSLFPFCDTMLCRPAKIAPVPKTVRLEEKKVILPC
jgi:hypothetical protein